MPPHPYGGNATTLVTSAPISLLHPFVILTHMAAEQLTLVEDRQRVTWRLDARTIERGKRGVQHARAVLAESVARAEARRAAERSSKPAAA